MVLGEAEAVSLARLFQKLREMERAGLWCIHQVLMLLRISFHNFVIRQIAIHPGPVSASLFSCHSFGLQWRLHSFNPFLRCFFSR